MERYDYKANIINDIKDYIEENDIDVNSDDFDYDMLYDDLFNEDSVTGNASGSYTFNTWMAEENICHNLDLLQDAFREFGNDYEHMFDAEYCDIIIRCYLLPECLQEVIDKLKQESDAEIENND